MKNTHLLMSTFAALAAVGALTLAGCSGDDSTPDQTGNDSGPGTDSGPGPDGGPGTDSGPQNPAPTLGAQIDRLGRPAVNTALTHAFDIDATAKGAAKDAYNSDKGVATWPATYTAPFAGQLGIFDSLDTSGANGSGCGNQFGFALGHSYVGLAGVLADDRLYVDTSQTACTTYLAVEVTKLLSGTPSDCGGRKTTYDVIDATYSDAVGGGAISDGVSASSPGTDTFPYLADPH